MMRRFVGLVVLSMVPLAAAVGLRAANDPPGWAYAIPPAPPPGAPAPAAAAPDPASRQLPGSTLSFPVAQIRDAFGPADWFPGDHPPMPEVVAKGRRPDVRACGLCHYPNGKGRPENAGVAGLPVAYFVQQMYDMQAGARRGAWTDLMKKVVERLTDEDFVSIAAYVSSRTP